MLKGSIGIHSECIADRDSKCTTDRHSDRLTYSIIVHAGWTIS